MAAVAAAVVAGGLIWRLTAGGPSGGDGGPDQATTTASSSLPSQAGSAATIRNLLAPLRAAPKEAFTIHFAALDPNAADCATAIYCEGSWQQADDSHAVVTTYYEGTEGIRYFAHGVDAITGKVTWSVNLGSQGGCLGATVNAVA